MCLFGVNRHVSHHYGIGTGLVSAVKDVALLRLGDIPLPAAYGGADHQHQPAQ